MLDYFMLIFTYDSQNMKLKCISLLRLAPHLIKNFYYFITTHKLIKKIVKIIDFDSYN